MKQREAAKWGGILAMAAALVVACAPHGGASSPDTQDVQDVDDVAQAKDVDAGPAKTCPQSCDDGVPCTTDTCGDDGVCHHTAMIGPAAACNDGVACTDDVCVDGIGCTHQLRDAKCNDDDPCTNDVCNLWTGCANPSVCDDGNACTTDVCDPKTQGCSHAAHAEGSICNACSGAVCLAGACTGDTNPCFDGDPCTADACDAKAGKCVHTKQACFKPETKDVCADPNDCLCWSGEWPHTPRFPGDSPCGSPSFMRQCSGDHHCYIKQYCTISESEVNCGCIANSSHQCPPWGNWTLGTPVCACGCVTPAESGDPYMCADCGDTWSCPPLPPAGSPCNSDKDCPEAAFCSGKNGCQADTCNDGGCVDDIWPGGGTCFACAPNGSGLSGAPIDCNDGNACTTETWSPVTGCVHTAKAEGAMCAPNYAKHCKSGACVKP